MKTIYLYNRLGQITGETKVDDEDFDSLNKYTWRLYCPPKGKTSYAVRGSYKDGNIRLHRVVMSNLITGKMQVDHKDMNGLNNQKNNLRLSTSSENRCNRPKQSNNTSGFKGVYWWKCRKKWQARISICGKHIHLGFFNDPREAHAAYKAGAEKHHGDFANAG